MTDQTGRWYTDVVRAINASFDGDLKWGRPSKLALLAPTKTSTLDLLPAQFLRACVYNKSHCKSIVCCRSISLNVEDQFSVTAANETWPSTSDFKNFRSTKNLKIVTKIVRLARLKSHLAASPNFCAPQSAYRTAHSTKTALVKIVQDRPWHSSIHRLGFYRCVRRNRYICGVHNVESCHTAEEAYVGVLCLWYSSGYIHPANGTSPVSPI